MSFDAAAVLSKVTMHARHLLYHNTGVMQQRAAGGRHLDAFVAAIEQKHAQHGFHAFYALAGRSCRDMTAARSFGDRARFVHVQKQAKVGKVKSHLRSIAACLRKFLKM